jgi:hypothetical protein
VGAVGALGTVADTAAVRMACACATQAIWVRTAARAAAPGPAEAAASVWTGAACVTKATRARTAA